jgi:PAS domain S-box-containing protein
MSLRTRLLLLVLVPLVPALLLALHLNLEQRRLDTMRMEKDAVRVVQLAASAQRSLLDATRQHLAALARLPGAIGTNTASFATFFANLPTAFTDYNDFGAVETNGQLISSTFRLEGQTNLSEALHVSRVLRTRDFAVGEFRSPEGPRRAGLLCGYPIFDRRGRLMRIVYASIDTNALARAAARTKMPPGSQCLVLDQSGTVVAAYPDFTRWVGTNIVNSALARAMFENGEGAIETKEPDGVSRFTSFTTIRDGDDPRLFVSVGVPTTVAFAERRVKLAWNLLILAAVAAIALTGAWYYASLHVVKPVRGLVEATRRVAGGDLTARAASTRAAIEFHELGAAFDDMTEALALQRLETASSQRALRESEERLRRVLETALDAVITIDEEGHIRSWNEEAERVFGWNRMEVMGRRLGEIIVPPALRDAQGWFPPTEKGATNRRMEITALHRDGHEFPAELSVTPVPLQSGVIYSVFIRDITARRRAEDEVRNLNASLEKRVRERTMQLEDLNKELEAFSYSVSHDLRAPLRHIDGFLGMLARDSGTTLSDTGRRYLRIISDAAKRMGSLIDDLLLFSRMGRSDLVRHRIDMQALVAEVRDELAADVDGRTVEWTIEPLPEVTGDRALLKQVWVNLLANAIKYTRDRQPARISIQSRENEDGHEFTVTDNGAGFDMRYVAKLFGVFQRLHRSEDFEGTGIGLANVRRIVVRHGGQVWAEGKINEGATFHFSIPRTPA